MKNVYGEIREVAPKKMRCAVGSCPSIYETVRGGKAVYLLVGKVVNPTDVGLVKKVGEGEMLFEVPAELIDEMQK